MGLDYEVVWMQDMNIWILQTVLICKLERRERESGNSIVRFLSTLSVLPINLLWIL